MRWTALTAGFTLALDQITKFWVVHLLDLQARGAIDVAPPYLNLRMAWNRGINFGLGASDGDAMRWVLIAVALVISALVIVWVRRERMGLRAQVAELEARPLPEAQRVEVPVIPAAVSDTLAEIAARAEALAAAVEDRVQA